MVSATDKDWIYGIIQKEKRDDDSDAWPVLEKQDAQVVGDQRNCPVLFLESLPPGGVGELTALEPQRKCRKMDAEC